MLNDEIKKKIMFKKEPKKRPKLNRTNFQYL